ncbi:geranylgeranyl pyrophosphate synthase-like isoform X2 [Gigantopelta aegis]|uniref:geranylgeranyl pyrophosphate synthase-like isoform X2 n=1 Tax=Gigantopelta aegis TaxID=1735272 RepID=UPI001B88D8B1|nr:geranylgeranyl pyrophosphate synthase-like isoform X2 [Gigantopelta aegis]
MCARAANMLNYKLQSLLTQPKRSSTEVIINETGDAEHKESSEEDNEKLQAFNYWLNIPDEKLKIILDVIQMLHNARMLIDDIEDYSNLRRGIPVAHNIFGVPHTINSANYVYFLGLQKLQALNHPDVNKIFTEQMLGLHQGQGMDIYWKNTNACPSEQEYMLMVLKKSGGLFGLGVKLMQLFSENKSHFGSHLGFKQSDFKHLINVLVCYFQVRDDYANLISKEHEANKSYASDLTEGRFSFPIIHAISSNPNDNQILSILRQRTTDLDVKKYCVELMDKKGSFEYTIMKLNEMNRSASNLIMRCGGNKHMVDLIDELKKVYEDNSC